VSRPAPITWRSAGRFLFLGCAFWALYFWIGRQLVVHDLIQNDIFFHSDARRAADDMCRFDYRHYRTNVHPLFVLFTNPIGLGLSRLLNDRDVAAVLLTSLAGALAVVVQGVLLLACGVPIRRAVLLTVLLGASAAHLFFGSAPETYAFSALSLLLLLAAATFKPGHRSWFVPASVFSFGILITNLASVALIYAATLRPGASILAVLRRTALLVLVVVAITAALAAAQKLIWPQSALFFVPASYAGESRFIKPPEPQRRLLDRELKLLRHVFTYDWFAPPTDVTPERKREIRVRMDSKNLWATAPSGRAATLLWLGILTVTATAAFRAKLQAHPLFAGAALSLLFNLGLHTVYGDDFFLYGCNTNFLLITLVGLAGQSLAGERNRVAALLDVSLAALVICEIANNWGFVSTLVSLRR
jgi:hypothetical protein